MFTSLILAAAAITSTPNTVTVSINGSIEESISRVLPQEGRFLGPQVARLLRWRGDIIKNVHPGDELRLIYEVTPEQPELLAMRYRGSEIILAAYRFTGTEGVPRFYDDEGRLIEPELKNAPTAMYTQITETMQKGRGKRLHNGVDLKAPEGTPVVLPFSGRVKRVNWSRRINGNCIEVETAAGRLVRFLHLASISPDVRPRAYFRAGAVIASVGNTGHSNAPHLHYEIRDAHDKPLDPLRLHGTARVSLPSDERGAFGAIRYQDDRLLAASTATAHL